MTDNKNLNNDFDFDDNNEFSFDLTDEEIKEISEREVARFKEEQEHKRTVDAAYDKIIGRFKAAPRNDQAHYEQFKAERLERFKNLDIVVADICKKHLHRESYHYEGFKNRIFGDNVEHDLIYNLCDIIQRVIHDATQEYSDDYAELSIERQHAIKALSIAIIDLAEGNI